MRATFFGFETARRALAASQRATDIAAHNIANANAPGYTRQQAVLKATDPYARPSFISPAYVGQIGTGVEVGEVRRLQSALLAAQARQVAAETGTWASRQEALSRLEAMLNEPGDSGLHSLFDAFWGSWHALSTYPADAALRSDCRSAGLSLCDGLRRLALQVEEMRVSADAALAAEVTAVNSLARRLDELNGQIRKVVQTGGRPNDLLDARDLLLGELSSAVGIQVREHSDLTVTVTVGGFELVQQFGFHEMKAQANPSIGYHEVTWAEFDLPVVAACGKLCGLLEMRDRVYGGFAAELDRLTLGLVAAVNAVHAAGFDAQGLPAAEFFDPGTSGALDIRLAAEVLADVSAIAASATGEPGDGANALAIARLEQEAIAGLGGMSLSDFYRGVVSSLGVETREAGRALATQDLLARQIANQRAAESGVSLDEEMVRLMEHQHAYNAAARLLTVIDEMIATLIERTGAGR